MAHTATAIESINPPTARRRISAEANKLSSNDRAAHDWYRFVLSYPPHLVRDYLSRFHASSEKRVLDPFCGTGTTIVECKKLAVPSVGVEAHPMAYFASATKVDWDIDVSELKESSQRIAAAALSELEANGIIDDPAPALIAEMPDRGKLRTVAPEIEKLLLKNSISPLPLHKTLVLRDAIRSAGNERFRSHHFLALAKALVNSISNLEFGPEVGVGPAKADVPVVSTWLRLVHQMVDDLRVLRPLANVPATVHHADSRDIATLVAPESIDIVITSPPYPNEKDYTRTTRLETILLGLITSKKELQALKRTMVRSNTRGVYKDDTDHHLVADHAEIQRIADAIEARRIELRKTSGFERLYAKVTKLYFGGMARHFADLRRVLRPNAHLAYVVGDQASYLRIMIRTGQLLASLAERLGYEVVGIDLFRTRLATATREQLREEVLVLRWPGNQ
ncbi:MAG: site-specific DNA-methyltransferase [Verrucomicrobiota bacterium]|nr:site-specific DNA-methyltransferase [Verrucomicrobiota bacterium]